MTVPSVADPVCEAPRAPAAPPDKRAVIESGGPSRAVSRPSSGLRLVARVGHELSAWWDALVVNMPGATGVRLREWYYRRRLRSLGRFATFGVGMEIDAPERVSIGNDFLTLRHCSLRGEGGGTITIGNRVSLASNVVVNAGEQGRIVIGDGSGLANNCVLRSSAHAYQDASRPFKDQGSIPGTIIIEEDVWVTANVTLLGGTHLERGCVVCPGSVVSGRVKAYTVVAGNPPRVIGKREARAPHAPH